MVRQRSLAALLIDDGLSHLAAHLASETLETLLCLKQNRLLQKHLREMGIEKAGDRLRLVAMLGREQDAMNAAALPSPSPSPSPSPRSSSSGSLHGPAPWLVGGSVPRVRWDDPSLEGRLRLAEPLVIEGAPFAASLAGRWSFDSLATDLHSLVNMHFAPRSVRRFERFYGRGLGVGGVTRVRFSEFASTASEESAAANGTDAAGGDAGQEPAEGLGRCDHPSGAWRFYSQALLLWTASGRSTAERGGAFEGVPERVCATRSVEHATMSSSMADDLRSLDWEWLGRALEAVGCEGLQSCSLWAGRSGGCTPLHNDALGNFFTQLRGRKRVLLFAPSMWACIYPYPSSHPKDTYAMADVEAPDLSRFPALRRASGLEANLAEGDLLWLPAYWWHHVHQLGEPSENISLNCWVGTARQRVDLGSMVMLTSGVSATQARAMEVARRELLDVDGDHEGDEPEPPLEELLRCATASAIAADAAATLTPDELALAEAEDERLIGVRGLAFSSTTVEHAMGLQTLLAARWLEAKMAEAEKIVGGVGGGDGGEAGAGDGRGADAPQAVGRFLNALAAGGDAAGSPLGEHGHIPVQAAAVIGSMGSPTYVLASTVRYQLLRQLGTAACCALLRVCTRHGRLHPGPATVGSAKETVNSEALEVTPPDEVARLLVRRAPPSSSST
jgi:hypothetical protein